MNFTKVDFMWLLAWLAFFISPCLDRRYFDVQEGGKSNDPIYFNNTVEKELLRIKIPASVNAKYFFKISHTITLQFLNDAHQIRGIYNQDPTTHGTYNDFVKWSSITFLNNFNKLYGGTGSFSDLNFALNTDGLRYLPISALYESSTQAADAVPASVKGLARIHIAEIGRGLYEQSVVEVMPSGIVQSSLDQEIAFDAD